MSNKLDFYKHNIEYFVENMEFGIGVFQNKSSNLNIEINPDLTINKLELEGLTQEQKQLLKDGIKQAILNLFKDFVNPYNYGQFTVEELEISFKDYIDYVLKSDSKL